MTDKIEKGRQVVREMLGEEFLKSMDAQANSGAFGGDAATLAFGTAFGDVWSRHVLSRRERSMITMAILIALRTPHELKNHVVAALSNGLSAKEIEEVIMQAIPYVGFPVGAVALTATGEVLHERGLLKTT
jgi:4-carboxymuconolactone decarboxylase